MNRPYPEVRPSERGYGLVVDRIAVRVARKHPDCTKRLVRHIVDEWIRAVRVTTMRTGRFSVPTLGVFYIGHSKARRIQNPVNGELMILPKTWGLKMRACKHNKGTGSVAR